MYEAGSFAPPFDCLLITGCMGWSMSLLIFVACVNTLAFLLFSIVCDPVNFQFYNRDGSYWSCYNSRGLFLDSDNLVSVLFSSCVICCHIIFQNWKYSLHLVSSKK